MSKPSLEQIGVAAARTDPQLEIAGLDDALPRRVDETAVVHRETEFDRPPLAGFEVNLPVGLEFLLDPGRGGDEVGDVDLDGGNREWFGFPQ